MTTATSRVFEQLPCAAGTLRRASRSLARLYDSHLMRAGLTTTQFSILWTVQRHDGSMALATLGEELVFERTSLYRALAPLRRAGLVAIGPDKTDRRAKHVGLTARAGRQIATAMPHWIAAQRAVLGPLGPAAWNDLSTDLRHLTDLARTAHAE